MGAKHIAAEVMNPWLRPKFLRTGKRVVLVPTCMRGSRASRCREIRVGTWFEGPDGSLIRFSDLPAGMAIEEAERIVA
jgi:hypothetical protein